MKNMENPLSPNEREGFDDLANRAALPPHLFTKIVEVMKMEGQIQTPKPLINRSPGGILTAFALAAGLACLGFWAGNAKAGTAPVASAGGKAAFLLLVHNDDTPAADPAQQAKEYGAWLKSIKGGRFADGEHLHANGWVISTTGTEARAEFPGRSEVGGYFFFEANDPAEAVKIAETCPHLKYNGTLELRQVYR